MMKSNFGQIRAIADTELELMLSWRNSPDVRSNMYTQEEISLEQHLSWWRRIQENPAHQYFMYTYNDCPCAIAALNNIDLSNGYSSWAFYASPDAPKGTGSRLEFLMLDYTFDRLQLHKLICEVLSYNSSVIKLHQKFGFSIEGIFRQQFRKPDGNYSDIHRLGLLKHEWITQRPIILERLLRQNDRA